MTILIAFAYRKGVLKTKSDDLDEAFFKLGCFLLERIPNLLSPRGRSSQNIAYNKMLIEDVIITDGKCFHQRIEIIVFLPKLAHIVSSFGGVYRVPSAMSIEDGIGEDLWWLSYFIIFLC